MKKLKGILRACLIAFVGCVVALNFMASPALAGPQGKINDASNFEVQATDEAGEQFIREEGIYFHSIW